MKNIDELEKALPHGSGIDYVWDIEERGEYIYARNAYHYMNEDGFYDGILPFTIRFPKNKMSAFDVHFHVNNAGRYRVNKGGVKEYIEDTIHYYLFER